MPDVGIRYLKILTPVLTLCSTIIMSVGCENEEAVAQVCYYYVHVYSIYNIRVFELERNHFLKLKRHTLNYSNRKLHWSNRRLYIYFIL